MDNDGKNIESELAPSETFNFMGGKPGTTTFKTHGEHGPTYTREGIGPNGQPISCSSTKDALGFRETKCVPIQTGPTS